MITVLMLITEEQLGFLSLADVGGAHGGTGEAHTEDRRRYICGGLRKHLELPENQIGKIANTMIDARQYSTIGTRSE